MTRSGVVPLCVVICLPVAAGAQQGVTLATVSGHVQDPAGAAVGGVSVTAASQERGQSWSTKTDSRGRFRFLYLPVDTYELRAEQPPFRPARRRVTLTVGQASDVPLRLMLEGAAETVDVGADAPLVETLRTQVSETVLPREIDGLPINGRNYLDLAALTPAVTRNNPVSNQRFLESSAVPGTGLSITGQRAIGNGFVVDGLSANDDATGLPGTFYSQEVIREFQVIASGGIAEFGRAWAGTINVLTRSGSNTWQGRAYGFLRDDALDASNPLAPTKDPLRQWQYGATASGPLRRDRTFLFANVEQTRRDGVRRDHDPAGDASPPSIRASRPSAIGVRASPPASSPPATTRATCSSRWIIASPRKRPWPRVTALTTSRARTSATPVG